MKYLCVLIKINYWDTRVARLGVPLLVLAQFHDLGVMGSSPVRLRAQHMDTMLRGKSAWDSFSHSGSVPPVP